MEEMKSKREKEVVQQLPGLDMQFYIPYSKVELTPELDMHAYRIGCLYMFTCTCKWNVSHHVHVLNMYVEKLCVCVCVCVSLIIYKLKFSFINFFFGYPVK